MTSTPGGKIAGGIIGGLVLAYLINKRYQYKQKENTNEEYQQEIDQKYVRKPHQVSTIQTLTESSINQPVFDNKLIQKIKKDLNSNRYLQNRQQIRSAFVNTKTTNGFYWEKPTYEKLYNIHEAEAKRIHEEEKKEAERIQEAAKLAVEKAAERAVEKAKLIQTGKEVAKNAAAYAKRIQEVKEKAKRIQKIIMGIQLPEYLREAEQSNINREQLIREFATYATIYKDERAAAEAKRIQEAEKLKEVPKHNNVVQNDMVPFEQNTTNDGDDEFFNALPPNNNKIKTGSSQKSKKHKRRTRRRHKKN